MRGFLTHARPLFVSATFARHSHASRGIHLFRLGFKATQISLAADLALLNARDALDFCEGAHEVAAEDFEYVLLAGTLSGRQGEIPISDGKVSGDDISFTTTVSRGGNEFKVNYKGKISGDEIRFTRVREGGQGQPAEFTAKRVK